MQAVGYVRTTVSGSSLAEQSQAVLDFCQRQGYELQATFMDSASAADDRLGFRQMIGHLRGTSHAFLGVVIPGLQTLGEDSVEVARRYFQLEALGAKVMPLDGLGDIPALLAVWQRRPEGQAMSEKVRTAMRRRAVRGQALGRLPYGYRVGVHRRLEVAPEEAEVVRYIFHLYLAEGLGIRRVARRLNEEEKRSRSGGYWSMVSVRDVLRNRSYLGTYSRFDVRVPGNHPRIIDSEEFRRVQERLNGRRVVVGERRRTPFLLAGRAYCGYCGNRMIGVSRRQRWRRRDGSWQQGEYRYYQCQSRTNQSLCDYHTHQAAELEAQTRQALAAAATAAPPLPTAGDDASPSPEPGDERRRLQERLRRLDRRLELYMEAAVGGRISWQRLHRLALEVATRRLSAEEELTAAEVRIRQRASASERSLAHGGALTRLCQVWEVLTFEERQRLLRLVVGRIIVRDDGVEVTLRVA